MENIEYVVLNPEGQFLQGRSKWVNEYPDATPFGSRKAAHNAAVYAVHICERIEGLRVIRDYGTSEETLSEIVLSSDI